MKCPNCQFENGLTSKYCASCGAVLVQSVNTNPALDDSKPYNFKRELGLGLGGALLFVLIYFLLASVGVNSIFRAILVGLSISGVMKGYSLKNRSEFFKSWRGIMIISLTLGMFLTILVIVISRGGR